LKSPEINTKLSAGKFSKVEQLVKFIRRSLNVNVNGSRLGR